MVSTHGVSCRSFLLDGQILYLEPKHTFKEFKMLRNKHQEGSNDGKEGDNGLETMIPSFGLKESLNQTLPNCNAFPVSVHWRQDITVCPAFWILIGQFWFQARPPYPRRKIKYWQAKNHYGIDLPHTS